MDKPIELTYGDARGSLSWGRGGGDAAGRVEQELIRTVWRVARQRRRG